MARAMYDRFIDMTIRYTAQDGKQKKIEFKCPRKGLKPSISLQYKRVPQDFCYEATLSVTNLWLPVNPEWVDDISLRIGYTNATGSEYACTLAFTVFTSYISTPGPDGQTIFECIVGSADAKLISDQPFVFSLYNPNPDTGKPWTVKEVLEESMRKAGLKLNMQLKPEAGQNPSHADVPFSTKDIPVKTFKSAYALVNWLQQALNDRFKNENYAITTALFNDDVFFVEVNKATGVTVLGKALKKVESYPILDLVENCEWNAGILTVLAPFVPDITPGKVFKINPHFYKASKGLPNTVARTGGQKSPYDMYTVITQQVSFSTDAENTMTLTAVPTKEGAVNNQADTVKTKAAWEELAQLYKTTAAEAANPTIEISFGTNRTQQQILDEAKTMNDVYVNTTEFSSTSYYLIGSEPGKTCLSKICASLPPLVGKLSASDKAPQRVPAAEAWFPFVALLTHSRYVDLVAKKDKDRSKWAIDLSNPNAIGDKHWLIIPSMSWKAVQSSQYAPAIIKVCELYYDFYNELGETSYAKKIMLIADLLRGGILE